MVIKNGYFIHAGKIQGCFKKQPCLRLGLIIKKTLIDWVIV